MWDQNCDNTITSSCNLYGVLQARCAYGVKASESQLERMWPQPRLEAKLEPRTNVRAPHRGVSATDLGHDHPPTLALCRLVCIAIASSVCILTSAGAEGGAVL